MLRIFYHECHAFAIPLSRKKQEVRERLYMVVSCRIIKASNIAIILQCNLLGKIYSSIFYQGDFHSYYLHIILNRCLLLINKAPFRLGFRHHILYRIPNHDFKVRDICVQIKISYSCILIMGHNFY